MLTFVAGHVTQKDGIPFKIVGQTLERCLLVFVARKRLRDTACEPDSILSNGEL
jgi:hypothetical protein